MKTRHSLIHHVLLMVFVSGMIPNPLFAQKPDKQLWFQWDDLVFPAHVGEYNEAAKAVNEFLEEQNYPFPMNAFSSDDFHFYYAMPISSYAAIDSMEMLWSKMFKEVGEEKMAPLWKTFTGTQESGRTRIFVSRPDLSYTSASSYLEDKDANFSQLNIMYPMYGMGMDFENVCRKWVDLYKSKQVDASYDIYEVVLGDDEPCYFFIMSGEHAAGYYAKSREIWGELKEEAAGIQQEMISLLRKVDVKHIWYRKDLSYLPGE